MLEIEIKGTSNSGKSSIAKLIQLVLNSVNIETTIIDELGYVVHFENTLKDQIEDLKKLQAVSKRHQSFNEVPIKMIQIERKAP
jgi:uridine kinase